MKKVFLKTFGCQMNLRDSEVVRGMLEKEGYKFTDDNKKADIVILNTCAVRQHAEDKVWSEIGAIKPGKIIGLIGCMAQNHKENAFERAPALSFLVGPSDIQKIPAILEDIVKSRKTSKRPNLFEKKIFETAGSLRPEQIYHTGFYDKKDHAYVVISEGCSNYCSYCVVPFVRGTLRHRKLTDILEEINQATAKGISKITLLGQNVNAYEDGNMDFITLLGAVNAIREIEELTFMTSHPKDTSAELFKAMADLSKLKKFLHLPLQSGSDKILKLMNRQYSRKFYLDLIKDYRKIVKDGILTTDIIVGFPSESADDLNDTLTLVSEIEFAGSFIFKYSPRPHTSASKMNDDVPLELKEKRHKIILEIQRNNSKKYKW